MANYAEIDGDWVRRPRFSLEQATMWVYAMPGSYKALEAVCKTLVNDVQSSVSVVPVAGAFSLIPPATSPVLVVVADILKGFSEHPRDHRLGFLLEQEIGFAVPVTLTEGLATRTTALMPYLWVSNLSAMVAGRDIYGLPKLLALTAFDLPNLTFTATSLALNVRSPAQQADDAMVARVEPVGPVVRVPIPGQLVDVTERIAETIGRLFGLAKGGATGFTSILLTLLKQFRDTEQPDQTCHQSIVEAEFPLVNLRRAAVLSPLHRVTIPAKAFPKIATTLGLVPDPLGPGPDPSYLTGAAFEIEVDFKLPVGKTLWP